MQDKSRNNNWKRKSAVHGKISQEKDMTENRLFAKKHSKVIAYLYASELSEIDSMVQSTHRLASKVLLESK